MLTSSQKLILWAWIHDLWKLAWRWWWTRSWNIYNIAHSEILIELFDDINASEEWKYIAKIASIHHKSDFDRFKDNLSDEDRFIARCIYMADNISAKERNEKTEDDYLEHAKNQGIRNIFSLIFQEDNFEKKVTQESYFNAQSLKEINYSTLIWWVQKSFFEDLFEKFKQDLKKIVQIPIDETTIYKLDVLLQNWLTFVPSDAYENIPDISLYDHSKTVVAFAQILYNFYLKNKNLYKENKFTDDVLKEVEITLIWWDFPSIQKYIINWIKKSSRITKRLRARSFLVQLIQEAVLQYVLDKLGLTRASVLISAGGKFVILSNKVEDIEGIQESINQFFVEKYPWLKFSLAKLDLKLKDIIWPNSDFKENLINLFEKLSTNKFQVYWYNNLKDIFKLKQWKSLCKYCGINYVDEDETEDNICENCLKEIKLGEKLVKEIKEKWIYFDYIDNSWNFKFEIWLDENWNLVERQFQILPNDWDFKKIRKWIVKSLNLYVPYKKDDAVKSFEEILKDSDSKYLVMVKWDVDNMSLILQYWFWESNYSLSRVLTFSRLLELFFGYRLQKFLEEKFKNVYTIYSWWDDFVFVLGLKDLEDFVKQLYNEFYHFTNNDKLHFSLGIWIFKDKTPIKQVFKEADEILSEAKNLAKDKMYLQVKNWELELEVLKYFGICAFDKDSCVVFKNKYKIDDDFDKIFNEIVALKDKETIRYKLYQALRQALEYLKDKNLWDYFLIGARVLYMLKRNLDDWKSKELIEDVKDIFSNLKLTDEDFAEREERIREWLLRLAYNIYLDRQKKNR